MSLEEALTTNHYDILGIAQTASTEEIEDAVWALRKVYEARSKQGDAEATRVLVKLNEAHATLSVPHLRSAYDRDLAVLADGFMDVAHSARLGRFDKLAALTEWLNAESAARRCSLVDKKTMPELFSYSPELDGEVR